MKSIVRFILKRFYGQCESGTDQHAFLEENVTKHNRILWILIIVLALSVYGLINTDTESITTVLTATLGPVMVLGAAWFAISFGGIPQKLLEAAMDITFWMFAAFMSALTVAMVAVCFVTHPALWPVWFLVYVGTYLACVMYDTADGFKAGLDEATLTHARYAIAHYESQGVALQKNNSET